MLLFYSTLSDFLFRFYSKPCSCSHLFLTGSHSEISFSGLHFPIKSLIERWIQGSDTCSLNKADAAISSSCLLPPASKMPCPAKECMEQRAWAFSSFSAKSCGLVKFPGHTPFHLQMAKLKHAFKGRWGRLQLWMIWAVFLIETSIPSPVMRYARGLPNLSQAATGAVLGQRSYQHQCWCVDQVLSQSTRIPSCMLMLITRPSCFTLPLCQPLLPHKWDGGWVTYLFLGLPGQNQTAGLTACLNYSNLMEFSVHDRLQEKQGEVLETILLNKCGEISYTSLITGESEAVTS